MRTMHCRVRDGGERTRADTYERVSLSRCTLHDAHTFEQAAVLHVGDVGDPGGQAVEDVGGIDDACPPLVALLLEELQQVQPGEQWMSVSVFGTTIATR